MCYILYTDALAHPRAAQERDNTIFMLLLFALVLVFSVNMKFYCLVLKFLIILELHRYAIKSESIV